MSASEISIDTREAPRSKQPQFVAAKKDPNLRMKQVIWAYFLLLIFEGALRKWILPFASGPILIIRDPVAIYLIVLANQRGLIKDMYAKFMIIIGILSFFTAMTLGHGNFGVALYGARILVIHFPLIFIIGRVFTIEDVIKIGKVTVWISLPMIVLVGLQFFSPQSAFVNRGVGGDEGGAGFSGAMGFFRPPGTFSFTNGNTLFFSFLAPFIMYFWLYPKNINRLLLLASTFALLASIPTSISRALFFSIIVTAAFTVIAVSRKPAYIKRVLGAGVGIVFVFMILSQTSMFQTATGAFMARFDGANATEGGVESVLLDRYLGGLLGAIIGAADQPFFGNGIGLGTNLGSQVFGYTYAPEGEWAKIAWEQGLILGFGVIIIRLGFSIQMLKESYNKLAAGNLLPWILLSVFLLNIPQAQWKQPTSLGFTVMIGGLQLAALRLPRRPKKAAAKPMAISQT
ncbi:hypothetical protein ACFQ3S_15790 [Mucilaginibacter terrae]|uniref:hypothetical protein n=1 Tax=Mucilaginibacter terrae TaxID=1955052 RepID=UPI003635FECC